MSNRLASIVCGTAFALAASGSAFAADLPVTVPPPPLPPAPVFSWTGFYIGGNVGYAWSHSNVTSRTTCGTYIPNYFNCGNLAVVENSGTGSLSSNSVTGGVESGYNWQVDNWVFGGEVDFDSLRMNASRAVTSAYVAAAPGAPFVTKTSIGTDWLFTARGRLGWTPMPQLLLYATGGLAVSRVNVANSFQDFGTGGLAFGASSNSIDKAGWTVGGGAEWMVAPNWSIKAEYLYLDLGRVSTTANVANTVGAGPAVSPLTSSFNRNNTQIVRIGLNYQFH